MVKKITATAILVLLVAACAEPGVGPAPKAYGNVPVQERMPVPQDPSAVIVLAVAPAKVQVDSAQNQRTAPVAGGPATASRVPGLVLADGVGITYSDHGFTFNTAQVGRVCEFAPGKAKILLPSSAEIRIQPNATCPTSVKTASG